MEIVMMLLALPLMLFGGFGLDAATNDDEGPAEADEPAADQEPIL